MADSLEMLAIEAADEVSEFELHGLVVGVAVATSEVDAQKIGDALSDVAKDEFDSSAISDLIVRSVEMLDDEEMAFYPVLADDEEPLDEKLLALGDWVGGFLRGYEAFTPARVADEVHEIVEDFSRIADVDYNTEEDEALYESYVELVEFVRVGTLLVRENLR